MSMLMQLAIAAGIFIAGVAGGIRWHARRDDGGSRGPLWLRVLAWLYLPYGLWLILQQIAKMRGVP